MVSNKSPPSSPPSTSLLQNLEKCSKFDTTLLENHTDKEITSQEISDLVHLEPTTLSTHKVGLGCPTTSSVGEVVFNFLDSSSFSKASEILLEDCHLVKFLREEVSLAPLDESIHDRRALKIPCVPCAFHSGTMVEKDRFNLNTLTWPLLSDDVSVDEPVEMPTPSLVTTSDVKFKDPPPYKSEETSLVTLLDAVEDLVANEPIT